MNIEMIPVMSSNVEKIGYHAESKTLAVQFKGGKPPYHYSDVPEEVHAAFIAAESVGSHFAKFIRGKFDHVIAAPLEGETP